MRDQPVAVTFEHWRCEFGDECLFNYGSPHCSDKRASDELRSYIAKHAKVQDERLQLEFKKSQLLLANEVFPEAAVADPLADLELWKEWTTGRRQFPYPGRYRRLGIQHQEGKVAATSSVGVLGEIMAGLFAQVGISPFVLVRVIHEWPDFIFYLGSRDRYAFIESKAFTTLSRSQSGGLEKRCQGKLLGDQAAKAVRQLNCDPFVEVWAAFTYIRDIEPMELDVTFVCFDCSKQRRDMMAPLRRVPEKVRGWLVGQAIARGAVTLDEAQCKALAVKRTDNLKGDLKQEREKAEAALRDAAGNELKDLESRAGPEGLILESRDVLEKELKSAVKELVFPAKNDKHGEKHESVRNEAAISGAKVGVRQAGGQRIFVRDLPPSQRRELEESEERNWERASRPEESPEGEDMEWRFAEGLYSLKTVEE